MAFWFADTAEGGLAHCCEQICILISEQLAANDPRCVASHCI